VDISKNTYTFKIIEECEIKADVYKIPGNVMRSVIMWIHGGALIMGHREDINFHACQLERYLDAGYTVVSIDYRLAPETKLKSIIEDVQDAYRWIRENGPCLFNIDPGRIAVVGCSAGGYLTLMSGFCLNPRPNALVSFYGYGDITGKWYSQPDPFYCKQPLVSKERAYESVGKTVISGTPGKHSRGDFYLYCRQQGVWPKEVTGYDLDTKPSALDSFCPAYNVDSKFPPTLLLHGDADTDVPYEQSVIMSEKLARAGIEHKLTYIYLDLADLNKCKGTLHIAV